MNVTYMQSSEVQTQLGNLGYINFKAICGCDSGNIQPSSMNITIKYIDGLQNKWQTLSESDFLVVTDVPNIENVKGSATISHFEKCDIYNYDMSYDPSTGRLTFRQPYVHISGMCYYTNTDYHSVNIYNAFPCTVYYKSTDLPIAP